ncbi:hypothetical protein RP20_CCG012160 [Aedes albopictus]|nr:hypothetical protein RP20_CCG012160 [Aedes albopictus]
MLISSVQKTPAKTTSKTTNDLLTKATQTDYYEMVSESPDLRTSRFHVNIPFGSQSPDLHVYMSDLRSNRPRSPPVSDGSPTLKVLNCNLSPFVLQIRPSKEELVRSHPTHNQPLQDSQNLGDPIGHSYQSTDSNRLVIAWSPSSSSNSSGMTQVSKAEAPPTATSPTGPQFREEQYDSIQPTIESRLRLQAVLRSLWPELFARGGSFCDFLHLLSVLALNIFPRLQPTTDRGAIELLRMVSPIACRLAYGNFEPIADKQARVCTATRGEGVREDRGAGGDGAESERCGLEVLDETQANSKSSSIDEAPMIVLSDDDEQENLPVRTKREYRVHK